jgi:hypothetical protein
MKKIFDVFLGILAVIIFFDITDVEGKIPVGIGLVIILGCVCIINMYPIMRWIASLHHKE